MNEAAEVVVEASALLAFLHREPGADRVGAVLDRAVVSAVNWCEVVRQALARGSDANGLTRDAEAVGVRIVPFDRVDAERAARLGLEASGHGLSLADCACLALAGRMNVPAVTADRRWAELGVGVDVSLIR